MTSWSRVTCVCDWPMSPNRRFFPVLLSRHLCPPCTSPNSALSSHSSACAPQATPLDVGSLFHSQVHGVPHCCAHDNNMQTFSDWHSHGAALQTHNSMTALKSANANMRYPSDCHSRVHISLPCTQQPLMHCWKAIALFAKTCPKI